MDPIHSFHQAKWSQHWSDKTFNISCVYEDCTTFLTKWLNYQPSMWWVITFQISHSADSLAVFLLSISSYKTVRRYKLHRVIRWRGPVVIVKFGDGPRLKPVDPKIILRIIKARMIYLHAQIENKLNYSDNHTIMRLSSEAHDKPINHENRLIVSI